MPRVISPERRRELLDQYLNTNAAVVVFTAGVEGRRRSKLRPDFEGKYRDQATIELIRQHLEWQTPRLFEDENGRLHLRNRKVQLIVTGGAQTNSGVPFAEVDKKHIFSRLTREEKQGVRIVAITSGRGTRSDAKALVERMQKEWPGSHILVEDVTSPFHDWRATTYLSKFGAEAIGGWAKKFLPAEALQEIAQKKFADHIIPREWLINSLIRIDQLFRTDRLENFIYGLPITRS